MKTILEAVAFAAEKHRHQRRKALREWRRLVRTEPFEHPPMPLRALLGPPRFLGQRRIVQSDVYVASVVTTAR